MTGPSLMGGNELEASPRLLPGQALQQPFGGFAQVRGRRLLLLLVPAAAFAEHALEQLARGARGRDRQLVEQLELVLQQLDRLGLLARSAATLATSSGPLIALVSVPLRSKRTEGEA